MIPSLLKKTLLSWYDSFVGRKRKKAWRALLSAFFEQFFWERNWREFENEEKTTQKLKLSFRCNPSAWVSMSLRKDSMPLIDFVHWVRFFGGFFFEAILLVASCTSPMYFGLLFCYYMFFQLGHWLFQKELLEALFPQLIRFTLWPANDPRLGSYIPNNCQKHRSLPC